MREEGKHKRPRWVLTDDYDAVEAGHGGEQFCGGASTPARNSLVSGCSSGLNLPWLRSLYRGESPRPHGGHRAATEARQGRGGFSAVTRTSQPKSMRCIWGRRWGWGTSGAGFNNPERLVAPGPQESRGAASSVAIIAVRLRRWTWRRWPTRRRWWSSRTREWCVCPEGPDRQRRGEVGVVQAFVGWCRGPASQRRGGTLGCAAEVEGWAEIGSWGPNRFTSLLFFLFPGYQHFMFSTKFKFKFCTFFFLFYNQI
jgi:hypothetical protein